MDKKIEAAIISSLLVDSSLYYNFDSLKEEHFVNKDFKFIYSGILSLLKKNLTQVTELSLAKELFDNEYIRKTFEEYGIKSLDTYFKVAESLKCNSIEEYIYCCRKVVSESYKTDFSNILKSYSEEASKGTRSIGKIRDDFNKRMDDLDSKYFDSERKIVPFGQKVPELLDKILNPDNYDRVGFSSIIPKLDEFYDYRKKELYVYSAESKNGKSLFVLNEGIYHNSLGAKVAFFDTEMSDELFFVRLAAYKTGIDSNKILRGHLTNKEKELLKMESLKLEKDNTMFHEYIPVNADVNSVERYCKQLKRSCDLDITIVDYLKSEKLSSSERSYELGNAFNVLKNNIAGNLDLIVIATCQKVEGMDTLSFSKSIKNYCTTLAFLGYKTDEQKSVDGVECGNYYIKVAANRIGKPPEGYIDCLIQGDIGKISQCVTQHTNTPY